VEEQLNDYIRRTAEPYGYLYLSNIDEAISRAISVDRHTITLLNALPPDDVQPGAAENIFSLGTINWGS
jgi:hypothetical protein